MSTDLHDDLRKIFEPVIEKMVERHVKESRERYERALHDSVSRSRRRERAASLERE